MSFSHQRRSLSRSLRPTATRFMVGQRVCIVGAPESYGYNGRTGTIVAIDGFQVSVDVDDPPDDMNCTTFYYEELLPTDEEKV